MKTTKQQSEQQLEHRKILIDKLHQKRELSSEEFILLYTQRTPQDQAYLASLAQKTAREHCGTAVFIRGLIEISNYCVNDCYYCGIRKSNTEACRYRLTKEEILESAATGYALGFRTFVLQGGEDPYYTIQRMEDIVFALRRAFPEAAITLSLGERGREAYERFRTAGADRYLLRHETATPCHYGALHPPALTLEQRQQELWELKTLGYQVGTGFMVGSPFQTPEDLARDLAYIKELSPQMVGIGPFVPHHNTPFADFPGGSAEDTLFLLSVLRLMLPKVLLPATTSLATIAEQGSLRGILAGANVIMPNVSPPSVRGKYMLYNKKKSTGLEAAESLDQLRQAVRSIGYEIVGDRGDAKS